MTDDPVAQGTLISASDVSRDHLRFLREVETVGFGYEKMGQASWIESLLVEGKHITMTPLPQFGVVEVKKKSRWSMFVKKLHADGHARVRIEE